MAHQYTEKTVATKEIFSGKIIKVQVDQVELPNGSIHTRELVKHPGAVGIIAITNEGKLVLVDQFRKPLERGLLEIPAGKLEPGEAPISTGIRELEEETGLVADQVEPYCSFYTSPGFADEMIHLFVARGLKKKENPASADEDELIDVVEVSLTDALKLIADGQICDAKTIIAVQYLQLLAKVC